MVLNLKQKMMKKALLSLGMFALLLGATAQSPFQSTKSIFDKNNHISAVQAKETPTVNGNRQVIWSDDFSVGANWVRTNTSSPPVDWEISTDLNASPFPGLRPFNFTTGSNGFAIINGDAMGDGSYQNASIRTANPIDLSDHPNILLRFQQVSRNWATTYRVRISTDGTNWTSINPNPNLAVNSNTENPTITTLNISTIAGGQATVWIEFNYEAEWGWFWAIDDIEIIPAPDNDLVLGDVFYGEYEEYPLGQERAITFTGSATNLGATTQTNAKLKVKANGNAVGESIGFDIPVGVTQDFEVIGTYIPSGGVGNHEFVFTVEQAEEDAVPSDNVKTRSIKTTEFRFSRDNNNYTGSGTWNGAGNSYILGNLFEITAPAQATSIEFVLQGNTEPGALLKVVLLGSNLNSRLRESDFFSVAQSNIATTIGMNPTKVRLEFEDGPLDLQPGQYVAAVEQLDVSKNLLIATGTTIIQPIQTTFIFDGTDNTWYYTTVCPMIRLNLNETNLSVNNTVASKSAINVYPNPASDMVNISLNGLNGMTQISIYNMNGQMVYNENFSTNADVSIKTINLNHLVKGVYFVNVIDNQEVKTTKLVLK